MRQLYNLSGKIMPVFLFLTALLSACSDRSKPAIGEQRAVFDAQGLQVITSFANRQLKTMSTLYGNYAARQSALTGYTDHVPGEVFTLVTYRQENNKYWYGSYINGAVQSVETVLVLPAGDAKPQFRYQLVAGTAPAGIDHQPAAIHDRINSILSHRPSVFP